MLVRLEVSIRRIDCAAVCLVLLAWLGIGAGWLVAQPGGEMCPVVFLDRAADLGVDFVHQAGAVGAKHLPETMGAGVAWLDYDGDGWMDLYLVQSGEYPPQGHRRSGASDRLFRNLGPEASGEFSFEDVTEKAGIRQRGYGQGVLAWDFDGDRDLDLVLSSFGDEVLLENVDGVFLVKEAPPAATRGATPWGTSMTAADVDQDGDLDLYIARYLDYDPALEHACAVHGQEGVAEYCDPSLFEGQRDALWRSSLADRKEGSVGDPGLGHGFTLDTANAGLRLSERDIVGKGLGALFVDLNGDGRPELYVANDITPNHLFINEGASFRDDSLLSGTAVNGAGRSEAGMGLAVVDDDRDGDPDLLVTNFDVETNTLYRNQGEGFFEDRSSGTGFGLPSFNLLGFALLAEDFDLDGWVDIFIANGHIFEQPKRHNVQYRQNDLFLKGSSLGFLQVPCAIVEPAKVSRGAASADFDLDGDMDVVVTHVNAAPSFLETVVADPQEWLGVHLDGAALNTESIGAVVTWRQARAGHGEGQSAVQGEEQGHPQSQGQGQQQTQELRQEPRQEQAGSGLPDRRWVVAGGSYLSSSSRELRFAVRPGPPSLDILEVRFASGKTIVLRAPPRGRVLRIAEGPGKARGPR